MRDARFDATMALLSAGTRDHTGTPATDAIAEVIEARDAEWRKRVEVARREGYNDGRCVGLWDAVEVAQDHEEKRTGGIAEDIRSEALHADDVKAADEQRLPSSAIEQIAPWPKEGETP